MRRGVAAGAIYPPYCVLNAVRTGSGGFSAEKVGMPGVQRAAVGSMAGFPGNRSSYTGIGVEQLVGMAVRGMTVGCFCLALAHYTFSSLPAPETL